MEFDRMGKNICSTKSVLFLSLSPPLSLQVFGKSFYTSSIENRIRQNSQWLGTLFSSLEKAFVPKKSNDYGEILGDPIREEDRKTWCSDRKKARWPISSRHENTRGLIKGKQWGLNDPIKRKLGLTCKKEGTEFELSFPGDAFSWLLFDTWRGMTVEKGRGRRKGGEKRREECWRGRVGK